MIETLTTREAARKCVVSFRTVIRWAERGKLQAYRLPGRADYRLPVEALRRFMREHGIPESEEMPGRALVVDDEPAMARAIKRVFARGVRDGNCQRRFARGLAPAYVQAAPDDAGPSHARHRWLRCIAVPARDAPSHPLKVLAVSGDSEEHLKQALALGAQGALCKPFDNEELLAAARELLGQAKAPARAMHPPASSG